MKKLLVVVDMQNDFITGSLGNKDCEAIVPNVAKKIRDAVADDYDVVFTMDTHNQDYLKTQEGQKLPVQHCIDGSNGWFLELSIENELHKAILGSEFEGTIYDSDACFRKSTFGCVDLGAFVKYNHYDVVTLVGVCTDICVISNAMLIKAFAPEVDIEVDSFCCAGVSPESHERALEAMKSCQIDII